MAAPGKSGGPEGVQTHFFCALGQARATSPTPFSLVSRSRTNLLTSPSFAEDAMLSRVAQSFLASPSGAAAAQDALRGIAVLGARHYHKNVRGLTGSAAL